MKNESKEEKGKEKMKSWKRKEGNASSLKYEEYKSGCSTSTVSQQEGWKERKGTCLRDGKGKRR